jgi:hypothetical protein
MNMGQWRYGSIHLNLGIGWEMSVRPASRPSRPTHTGKEGRQQSLSIRFGKDRHHPLSRIEPRCLYCRLTACSLITIPTELFPLVAEQDPVHTEDGKHNRNTRQYRNKIACFGCTERTSVESKRVKAKQSHYRPWQALRVTDLKAFGTWRC